MNQNVGPTVGKGWGDDARDPRQLRRPPAGRRSPAAHARILPAVDIPDPAPRDMRARTVDVAAARLARRRAKAKAARLARRKNRR